MLKLREKVILLPVAAVSWLLIFLLTALYLYSSLIIFLPSLIENSKVSNNLYIASTIVVDSLLSFGISFFISKNFLRQKIDSSFVIKIILASSFIAAIVVNHNEDELFFSISTVVAMLITSYIGFIIAKSRIGKEQNVRCSEQEKNICANANKKLIFRRFYSTLINVFIIMIIYITCGILIGLTINLMSNDASEHTTTIGLANLLISSLIVFFVLFRPTIKSGTNIGKRLFGIYIVSDCRDTLRFDQVLLQVIFSLVSFVCGASFLPASYDNRGRLIYERAVGVTVIMKNKAS